MNPYQVLGVSASATDDEVKAAYRKMVKKYHPDRYTDSALKEQASEKLKEINAAYDAIVKMRKGEAPGASGMGGGYSSAYGMGGRQYRYRTEFQGTPRYGAVKEKIRVGDIGAAEAILDSMGLRDAEWHYWKGVILLQRGWYDGARQHFTEAHNMDPTNEEYVRAFYSVNDMAGFGGFGGMGGRRTGGTDDCCPAICIPLWCCCPGPGPCC